MRQNMHLYKIRTKSGKEYNEVLVTDKLGEASNPLYTILSGSPRIFVAGGNAKGVVEIPFGEIESAIEEGFFSKKIKLSSKFLNELYS